MYKVYSKTDFYNLLSRVATRKDNDIVSIYLKSTGCIINIGQGMLNITSNIQDIIDNIVGPINPGDIVWSETHGMLLIFDKPCRINGQKSYRGIQVNTKTNGAIEIYGQGRSVMIEDQNVVFVRHTSFDIDLVKKLCDERSQHYTRINSINDQLTKLTGDIDHVS